MQILRSILIACSRGPNQPSNRGHVSFSIIYICIYVRAPKNTEKVSDTSNIPQDDTCNYYLGLSIYPSTFLSIYLSMYLSICSQSAYIHMDIHIHIYTYIYMYVYIQRERERQYLYIRVFVHSLIGALMSGVARGPAVLTFRGPAVLTFRRSLPKMSLVIPTRPDAQNTRQKQGLMGHKKVPEVPNRPRTVSSSPYGSG